MAAYRFGRSLVRDRGCRGVGDDGGGCHGSLLANSSNDGPWRAERPEDTTARRRAGAYGLSPGPPTRPRTTTRTRVWRAGRSSDSRARTPEGAPNGRRFPNRYSVQCFVDGGRSRSPLRGSPGITPDSLLRRPARRRAVRTSCLITISCMGVRSNHLHVVGVLRSERLSTAVIRGLRGAVRGGIVLRLVSDEPRSVPFDMGGGSDVRWINQHKTDTSARRIEATELSASGRPARAGCRLPVNDGSGGGRTAECWHDRSAP